ncbi:MAG: FlgD immunoglobulin-like domain containing protein [bacterium]
MRALRAESSWFDGVCAVRAVAGCLIVIAAGLTSDAQASEYWNDLRRSALLPDSTITVRIESPAVPGAENSIIYSAGGVVEQAMVVVLDGPSTLEATVPGPVTASRYYGFRLLQDGELDFVPVRIADGVAPGPGDLTRVAEDASGDNLYPTYVNLDLVDCHVSFSGERLYASLTNAGGGFPVSSGLTFFGYLLGVANPAQSDPDTVFALMQTFNQPGIIEPGLYKITGTGMSNLHRIGEVVTQEYPTLNTLMISCDLADLMADPYFMSWYDPADPAIGVAGFSQRITLLGGASEADRTPGGDCYLREFPVAPETNATPQLSGFDLVGAGAGAQAEIIYSDANGNCPVLAEVVFDDTLTYAMYPQSLDYGSAVAYRTEAGIAPLAADSWTHALVRFSDDLAHWAEYVPAANGVPGGPGYDDGGDGSTESGAMRVSIAPSPFVAGSSAGTSIELVAAAPGGVRVRIYDGCGALVRSLGCDATAPGPARVEWDGRDGRGFTVRPGIYFCRVEAGGRARNLKIVAVK